MWAGAGISATPATRYRQSTAAFTSESSWCSTACSRPGFQILQFNAVVATNTHARHLYERLGFQQLGVIPNGFRLKGGQYEAICPYFITL